MEAMLEPFEGFFDAPALVIKVSKLTGWKTPHVKQVCHQDTDLSVWRDVADQTYLLRYAGALEVQDVLAISCPQRDDLLAKSAALGKSRTQVKPALPDFSTRMQNGISR